jgi:hypothetical protein
MVPPRATAVLSSQNTPTQRDRHAEARTCSLHSYRITGIGVGTGLVASSARATRWRVLTAIRTVGNCTDEPDLSSRALPRRGKSSLEKTAPPFTVTADIRTMQSKRQSRAAMKPRDRRFHWLPKHKYCCLLAA